MDIAPAVTRQFVSLTTETSIAEMIGKLKQADKRAALVFDSKHYSGVVDHKGLLQTRIDPVKTKVGKFLQKTPLVEDHDDVVETAYLMFQSNLELVPVQREKEIIGVIEALDLAKEALEIPEVQAAKVKDLRLVTIPHLEKDDQISTAMHMMYEEHIDHLPLIQNNDVYGIVSMQDIVKKYLQWPQRRPVGGKFRKELGGSKSAEADVSRLSSLPISSFSTNENLVSVQLKDSLQDAVNTMIESQVHSLLVMDGKELA